MAGFVLVHLWLLWATRHAPNQPLYDVPHVYLPWVRHGLASGHWVGLDKEWVYPIGALGPMVLVATLGLHHYGMQWIAVVTAFDAVACLVLGLSGPRGRAAAAWWLVFLAALGPIALGRIDAMTVPLAMVAVLLFDRRPGAAAALLTLAAWIKVWPVALVVTLLIATRSRLRVVVASVTTALSVVTVALLLGASVTTLVSFLAKQSGRGLQLESLAAEPWLWVKALGGKGVHLMWRPALKAVEVVGHGTSVLSHAMTPVMLLLFGVVCALGIRAARANVGMAAFVGPLALALTTTLIVTDKVGSPQYQTWLAAPVVLGLLHQGRGGPSFRFPAFLAVVIAALTQILYPWEYASLNQAHVFGVLLATTRNGLLLVLLGIGIRQLVTAGAPKRLTAVPPRSARVAEPELAPAPDRSAIGEGSPAAV